MKGNVDNNHKSLFVNKNNTKEISDFKYFNNNINVFMCVHKYLWSQIMNGGGTHLFSGRHAN